MIWELYFCNVEYLIKSVLKGFGFLQPPPVCKIRSLVMPRGHCPFGPGQKEVKQTIGTVIWHHN